MQALILAGGEGRRMGRMTTRLPKPLMYLPGGTLLEHQVALLARLPVSDIFVVVQYRAWQLEQALPAHEGVTVVPQKRPFTLLGALASAEEYVTEPFVVLHADNYFSKALDYLPYQIQAVSPRFKLEAVFLVDPQAAHPEQAVRLASTGCYVLSPEVFPLVRRFLDADRLSNLTRALLDCGAKVEEVPLRGWRANVNHLPDLLQVSSRILDDWSGCFHPAGAADGYNRAEGCLRSEQPLWISPESEIVDSELGPRVVVGPGASVRGSVLRKTIVFPGAEVVGQRLEGDAILPGI